MKGSRDLLLKFWDPSIFREGLKLETLNLAGRLDSGGPNKKCKIRSKGIVKESRDLLLEFLDPPYRERLKVETSKLADKLALTKKNAKLGQKGGRDRVT